MYEGTYFIPTDDSLEPGKKIYFSWKEAVKAEQQYIDIYDAKGDHITVYEWDGEEYI